MYRLLLADDETEVLEGLKTFVPWNELGFHIAGAADTGTKALDILRLQKIDLFLTDIRMPGKSGIDIIREIRESDRRIRIIILSGYGDFAYAKQAIPFDVEGYLLKPVMESELTALIRAAKSKLCEMDAVREPAVREVRNKTQIECIIEYIDKHYREEITLKTIAENFFVNKVYLGQIIKNHLGESFSSYINQRRIREAVELIITEGKPVKEAIGSVGFCNPEYFYRQFRRYAKMSFGDYKRQKSEKLSEGGNAGNDHRL